MDKFAEDAGKVTGTVSKQPLQLFAEDLLLQAKNAKGLRRLLDIATEWAHKNSMAWNTKLGKSEVLKCKWFQKQLSEKSDTNCGDFPT